MTDKTAMANTEAAQSGGSEPGAVLSLAQVAFGYEPGQAVVAGLSAGLWPGRLCVLIGPNAAGKSTLLKLMLGQLKPWGGQVRLGGGAVADLSAGKRAAWMSYVPQRGSASFLFTVRQVIEMARYAIGPDAQAVRWAISQCDLRDVEHRVFAHLSGGQQQRVMLARAMAQSRGHGRVMLLDEPASSMDLWHVHRTMQILRELARSGLAVLVVLHDLNLAASYADELWLMDGGKLVAAGPWQTVLEPELLERIYRVRLTKLQLQAQDDFVGQGGRPLFVVHPPDKLT
jgi:iron complex transport system ATP-binding protein